MKQRISSLIVSDKFFWI